MLASSACKLLFELIAMALTHSIFKKRLPTEIPIQPAVVELDEKDKPDTREKVITAYNLRLFLGFSNPCVFGRKIKLS